MPSSLPSDLSVERNRTRRGADGLTDEERDTERVKKVLTHSNIVFLFWLNYFEFDFFLSSGLCYLLSF